MSMTENPSAPPAPKKRKYIRRKRAVPATPKPADNLAGLTATDCPKACGVTGCVISGNGICSHPLKGGLQGRAMSDLAALERFKQAQKILGKKRIDARFA